MTTKLKGGIYLRVSTASQDENHQLSSLLKKAEQDNVEIQEQYIFRDKVSGFKTQKDRAGLNALLQLTREDIQIVYCFEVSRLSRDFYAFDELLKTFRKKLINVCFLQPYTLYMFKFPTIEPDPMTDIVMTIISRIAYYEIENKDARLCSGKREAINRGDSYAYFAPYGYRRDNKKLVINDTAVSDIKGFETPANIVRSIFELYCNGVSTLSIAEKLNTCNISTNYSTHLKKDCVEYKYQQTDLSTFVERDKLKWVKKTVFNILTNTVYAGHKQMKNTDKVNGEKVVRMINIDTPAIIDEDLFLILTHLPLLMRIYF